MINSLHRLVCIGGAGNACLDYLFIALTAAPGGLSRVREYSVQGGGLTATALAACARLGADTRFVSMLGNDSTAPEIEAELDDYGVKKRFIHRVPGVSSPVSFIHQAFQPSQKFGNF